MRLSPTIASCIFPIILVTAIPESGSAQELDRADSSTNADRDLAAKSLAELKLLLAATSDDEFDVIARKWRFESPRALQKQIIKSILKSEELQQNWGLGYWRGIDAFLHFQDATRGIVQFRESEPFRQRLFRLLLTSLEFPFDPDLSKLYIDERRALAKAEGTPIHVLRQLLTDGYGSTRDYAERQLAARKAAPVRIVDRDLSSEGKRAQFALEELAHCRLPASGAMTEDDKQAHMEKIFEVLVDAMDMPLDPDVSKLRVAERLKLAWSEHTPLHVFKELLKDPDPEIRVALTQNRRVPLRYLASLRTDKDPRVAAQVEKRTGDSAIDLRELDLKETAAVIQAKRRADTEKEIKKLMEAPDQSVAVSLIRHWRFDIAPDLKKSIFAELLTLVGSEKPARKT